MNAGVLAADFTPASVSYAATLPVLVVAGAAIVCVLIEAFAPRSLRYPLQLGSTLLALAVAFGLLIGVSRHHVGVTAAGAQVIDRPALFLQGTLLVMAFVSVLMMAERLGGRGPDAFTAAGSASPGSVEESEAERVGVIRTEVFPLALFSVAGMLMFVAAGDLLMMFVALEVLSLPLYVLTGLARRRRLLSQEAALKYFLLGAFASAFFLFGTALLYGFAGSLRLSTIAEAVGEVAGKDSLAIPGVMLVLVGLLFKVGAVPFHSWTPDVYQGAPTAVTGFMAACTKVAAYGALMRVLYTAVDGLRWNWQPVVAIIAVVTMVVGVLLSITQTDVKRLLAYSSVTHAGFLLVGLVTVSRNSVSSVLFYLVCYGFITLAAFGLTGLVRTGGAEASQLDQWAGLGRRSPLVAALMSFLMLAFAGIPLTSGFTAKFAVFGAAVQGHAAWLAVVGVLVSAVSIFVYVRLIVLMYFTEPKGDTVAAVPSPLAAVAIAAGVLITLALGVMPSPLLDLAHQSAQFLR